jgi:hypothetical protein
MPRAAKAPPRLTDAQLKEVLALTSHADSVELKLTVPDSEHRSTVAALGMDPLDAQVRQVFFFDTPDLRLNRQGVVVRARRVQGRGDDTVVKLRPIVPDQLPASVRNAKTMVVEVDAVPGGYVCSASFKGALGPGDGWWPSCGCTPTGSRILELSTKCLPGGRGLPGRGRGPGVP